MSTLSIIPVPGATSETVQEDASFAALRRAVLRADGFTLFLAICNEPARRKALTARLHETLPSGVTIVQIPADCRDVLPAVASESKHAPGSPMVIEGLELGVRESDLDHPRIVALNQRREEWRLQVPCPVVFWTPEYLLRVLARSAPDFLDWRAGTFLFLPSVESQRPTRSSLEPWSERDGVRRLDADERLERINRLRELIAEYGRPPHDDEPAIDEWLLELADHLTFVGQWDEALDVLENELLPRARKRNDPLLVAVTQSRIADTMRYRGELDEALRILREELLPEYERLGDVRERAITMSKVADILEDRGQLDEALRIRREEELPVFEQLGDVRARAVTMGKIADILQARGEWDEALRIRCEEQLPVYERLRDIRERALTMGQIADILQARGEWDEALRIRREEELPVYERLGDVRARAVTMGRIADALRTRGELDEAMRIHHEEALPVFEQLGDVRSRTVTMGKIADILQSRGEFDNALRIRLEQELPVYERLGDVRERAVTMAKIADVLRVRGKPNESLRIFREEVMPALKRLGDMRLYLVCQANLALALWSRNESGDREEARTLLADAHQAAERLQIPEAEQIRLIQIVYGLDES